MKTGRAACDRTLGQGRCDGPLRGSVSVPIQSAGGWRYSARQISGDICQCESRAVVDPQSIRRRPV